MSSIILPMLSVISSYFFSPKIPWFMPIICSLDISTSPSAFIDNSSPVAVVSSGSLAGAIFLIISITSCGAPKILEIFWNRKLDIKPLFTTSLDLILRGIERTFSASSSIISPCSSSPITGKKLSSSFICALRVSESPLPLAVSPHKSLANFSKIISVRAGSKSNT